MISLFGLYPLGEIFHVSSLAGFTYYEAVDHCRKLGSTLASTGELYAAWNQGFHKCSPGWLSDRSVRYPVRNPGFGCGGNKTGVHTVYAQPNQTGFPNPYSRYGAYCIKGIETFKPEQVDSSVVWNRADQASLVCHL
uniref:Link domain-containing protein n=1 Tax=Sinocyclocheilus grahami TaxID=75366 RepID=A0A672SG08_SINGR